MKNNVYCVLSRWSKLNPSLISRSNLIRKDASITLKKISHGPNVKITNFSLPTLERNGEKVKGKNRE